MRADLISNNTQDLFSRFYNNTSEKYRIYKVGPNQSQFSISVQGIIIYFIVPAFRRYLLLSCRYVTEEFIEEKYEGCKLIPMMNSYESKQYSVTLSSY